MHRLKFGFFLWLCVFHFNVSIRAQTLIINEVSNGASGNKEYVEFVVADTTVAYDCSGSEPPCIDIRGWIFDDNSGYHGTGGVAQGALRFSNDVLWSCLPLGTIILLYNDADPGLAIPASDLTMADNNCRLVVPVSSALIERNGTTPGAVSCSYPTTGWVAGGNWSNTLLANAGDCARVVDLAGCEVFSLCWASCSTNTLIYFNSGGSGSQNVWYFNGTDPNDQANWSEGSASGGDETPGVPNNAENAAFIAQFNNQCQPIPVLTSSATSTDSDCGQCTGTATVIPSGSLPGYSFAWFDANDAPLGQTGATATSLCQGVYRVIVTSSIGCTDTSAVTINSSGNAVISNETVQACLGSTVTYPDGVSEIILGPTTHASSLSSTSGCDSTIITDVLVVTAYAEMENIQVCEGSPVTFPDGTTETVSANTTHVSALTSANGCDSVVTTNVTVVGQYDVTEQLQVCGTTDVTYPDGTTETVSVNTTHVSALTSTNGCDSVVTTNVLITPAHTEQQFASVCVGEVYLFPDGTSQTISANVSHTAQLQSAQGCDSLVVTQVTAWPGFTERETVVVCQGSSYTFADGTVLDPVSSETTHASDLVSVFGCDSVHITTLILDTIGLQPVFYYTPVNPDQDHNEVAFLTEQTGMLEWTVTDLNGHLLYGSTDTGFSYVFPYDSIFPHVVCLSALADGCTGTVCDTITLEADLTVYIPNTFTPHLNDEADGLNDVFLPIISGGEPYLYQLEIFNRWGQKLFETADPYLGWDGFYKGKVVESAVYVYRLRFSIKPLTFVHQYTGHVNVLR